MKRTLQLLLPLGALIATAAVLVLQASAGVAGDGNRLQATFNPNQFVSSTNGDGIVEVIVSGAGTVDGFGAATEVVGLIQDHAVNPCGAGSYTDTATRPARPARPTARSKQPRPTRSTARPAPGSSPEQKAPAASPSPASAPRTKPKRSQGNSSSRTRLAEAMRPMRECSGVGGTVAIIALAAFVTAFVTAR
jgi:hypothetical protein